MPQNGKIHLSMNIGNRWTHSITHVFENMKLKRVVVNEVKNGCVVSMIIVYIVRCEENETKLPPAKQRKGVCVVWIYFFNV